MHKTETDEAYERCCVRVFLEHACACHRYVGVMHVRVHGLRAAPDCMNKKGIKNTHIYSAWVRAERELEDAKGERA